MIPKWEYLTIILEADAAREEDFLRQRWDWKAGIPPYTAQALIPRMDALGEDGWELVHMQPAHVGNKGDVLMFNGNNNRVWGSTYFCVFKRPKVE
jgi:hypothetical protein